MSTDNTQTGPCLKAARAVGSAEAEIQRLRDALDHIRQYGSKNTGCGFSCSAIADIALRVFSVWNPECRSPNAQAEPLPPDSERGAAVETALGEAPFVCEACGEWKQSGEMHRDSNGRRILCMDCGWKESPNATGSPTPNTGGPNE